ncbi:MAG: amidohydrolase [Myxococcales bacterium]|nr:amidohydrolase [Myxococcales bacterium]
MLLLSLLAAADLIVTNARIWTVDRTRPEAEALAIIGERIVAVGSDKQMKAWRGPSTKIIDAHGRRVLPGFNDAHLHFIQGGFQLDQVQLTDARSPEEFAARIAAKARPGEWILGGDWDEEQWNPPRLPTRSLIDDATAQTPVFVSRHDGHEALANSLALKLAGITARTNAPPGGEIVRDARGEPTGILKDAAMDLVDKVVPKPTPERLRAAAKRALAHAASLGVTSVQHMNPEPGEVAAYSWLAERGELTARIYNAPMETTWEDQARIGIRRAFGSSWLRLGAVKGYADGSLGSATAWFFQPFLDHPGNGLVSGEMQDLKAFRDRLIGADAAGLQICIHAIGDHAISSVLDTFTEIENINGLRERRWRIEHLQHVAPKDFGRLKQLGVVGSMQPYHAIDDGQWAERRIGPERAQTTYAFRTLLDKGIRLAFGTDWSVAPLNPLLGLFAAVTRETLDGKHPGGWVPEQKISLAEAVEAYTLGSAYAEFQEKEKGTLAPGKLADLVVLDGDIFHTDPHTWREVKVDLTLVGGKIVYQRAR